MALTPEETLQRRLTDPYFGLAEELAPPSLAQQKGMNLAAASVEKKRRLNPAEALADEALAELEAAELNLAAGPGAGSLLDIAESSLYQSREHLFDAVSGNQQTNQQIQEHADFLAGVSPEDRKRLVSDPQQKVVESLAEGRYLDAAGNALLAGPGTAADSAGVVPELVAGAALTAATGVGGAAIFGRRLKKGANAVEDVVNAVQKQKATNKIFSKAKDMAVAGVKGAPKAAGQVSIATADITQRQLNDFREKHGVDATREEAAQMFGLNLLTFMVEPTIIKNLFIPSFKKEIGKEIKTLASNFGSGSNLASIGKRLVSGTKKVTTAGGAEAGQEYFQTWAENLNVGMGPEQRKTFWESVGSIIGEEDSQMQALVGAYLGGGAGTTIRAAVTVPAVAAGTTVDVVKGTTKRAITSTKKGLQNVANEAALKVLSQEERDVIKSEFKSRKVNVDKKTADIRSKIESIKGSTAEQIKNNPATAAVAKALQENNQLTDEDLRNPSTLKHFKAGLERAYKADILKLRAELEASNVAAIAIKSGKNIKDKTVQAAKDIVDAVPVDVKQLAKDVKKFGSAAVKAVKELESSTALGVIELAGRGTKNETKAALTAAQNLSLRDLNRVASIVGVQNPGSKIAKQFQTLVKKKEAGLERVGLTSKTIIDEKTVPPVIKDINKAGTVSAEDASTAATALNQTIASKLVGEAAVAEVEGALKAYENSKAFKDQVPGAMSPESMNVLKAKLARKAERIRKPKRKKLQKFLDNLEKKGIREVLKDTAAVKQAAKLMGTDTAKGIIKWLKDNTPDLKALQTEQGQADLEASLQAGLDRAVKIVKGPKDASKKQDKADKVRTKSELPSGPLNDKLRLLEKALVNPETATEIVAGVDKIYNAIKKAGVDTRDAWHDLVEQFPGLQVNVQFFKELDQKFPDSVATDEMSDTQATQAVSTDEDIKNAYNKLNPPECKI